MVATGAAPDASERAGGQAPRPARARSSSSALLAVALVSVAASLLIRVIHRGSDVAGWDILLTVEGEYLLATRGLWGTLAEMLVQVRTYWLPPSAYSVPYGLLPGALAWWWPSVFWQPLVVFLAWLATLAALLAAAGWKPSSRRGWTIALLAWGASPSLLSYAVEGYPWGAGMLPHALALALALGRRPWRWWTTLLGLALVWELPWHGYEIGKTAGLTLLACAAFAPGGGIVRRFAWAATGAAGVVAAWHVWPSHNMIALGQGNTGTGVGIVRAVTLLPDGLNRLAEATCDWHPLIAPTLAVAGAVALFWTGPRRNALAACWLVQLVLVVLLAAAAPGLLRARRFQGVDVLSIAALLAAMRGAPRPVRATLVALLLAGNLWTLAEAVRFVSSPPRPYPFSLPGVQSEEGVGMLDLASNAWARGLAARVRAGERVVVLHGQGCPTESMTNPVAVLERLYVGLGHEAFRAHVVAVGSAGPRYVTVPVVDVRSVLDTLSPGTIVDLDTTCAPTMADVLRQIQTRWRLEPLDSAGARFVRFRVAAGNVAPASP